MHTKTAWHALCMHTRHCACNLLSPVSVDVVLMVLSFSSKLSFLWLLKSWSCLYKCLQGGIALEFLISFMWLLSPMLTCVSDLPIFWIFQIWHLIVCSCHVTYAFQSESTLYSCLNVKELLAWNRRKIWSLSDCNCTRIHNHLVRKCDMTRTYSQMHRTDKYSQLSSIIWSVWPNGWMFIYELSGCRFESSCSHL